MVKTVPIALRDWTKRPGGINESTPTVRDLTQRQQIIIRENEYCQGLTTPTPVQEVQGGEIEVQIL
jgi:hypothetical protein